MKRKRNKTTSEALAASKFNIPAKICKHLVGKEHTIGHRLCVGVLIMCVGVMVSKIVFIFDSTYVHYVGDIIGYGIHGIGLTPFVEMIVKSE